MEKYGKYGKYGKELILDLHDCRVSAFTESKIEAFMIFLCDVIDMERAFFPNGDPMLFFWDEHDPEQPDHLIGVSAVQFIHTSNITIHTLDKLRTVYLNVFSCKDFDSRDAVKVARQFFGGEITNSLTVERG